MNDYVYLEECGRQVSEWATNIADSHLQMPDPRSRRGGKRELLQTQLESVQIIMELAPLGMQRQTLNRSTWKPKCVSDPPLRILTLMLSN